MNIPICADGISCPQCAHCGCPVVGGTRKRKGRVMQYRRCGGCGHRFKTEKSFIEIKSEPSTLPLRSKSHPCPRCQHDKCPVISGRVEVAGVFYHKRRCGACAHVFTANTAA